MKLKLITPGAVGIAYQPFPASFKVCLLDVQRRRVSDKKDVMMSSGRGLIHVRVPGIASQPETEQNRNCPSNGQTLQAAWWLENLSTYADQS